MSGRGVHFTLAIGGVCLALAVSAYADLTSPTLVFKMTADKTELLPGEQTTVRVWAWVFDPASAEQPDNGLEGWQMDLDVDNTGVISIVGDLNLLAPDPGFFSGWDELSVNSPATGEVRSIVVDQDTWGAPSLTGVGVDSDIDNNANYSELFNFTIEASLTPSASQTTYTLMDDGGGAFYGYLRDGMTTFDNDPGIGEDPYGGVYFYDLGSDHVFTIATPEPSTVFILAVMTGLTTLRRRR